MKIFESLLGCSIVHNKVYSDLRGSFTETYKRSVYPLPQFKQWNVSVSHYNVIRGLHYQAKNSQGKLVRVLRGAVVDVVVDIRTGSPTYGKMEQFYLTPDGLSVYVPVGFAHSFWVTDVDETIVQYGCTEEYDSTSDGGISPIDPDMPYPWKEKSCIISDKDKSYPKLKDFKSPFKF
jgi:dTDP-4-dehydrorhamnose 3,5-epimerase